MPDSTTGTAVSNCPLCRDAGGLLLVKTPKWRVIRSSDDGNFPAFYRLIWNAHVAEFSDLDAAERSECMEAVTAIERVLREALQATKINLATFGNVVPHLHWHVIARFDWDSHFPNPVWGAARREVEGGAEARLALPLVELDRRVAAALLRP
ncbi:HIT family protein [Pelomonas sp. SE-A7]|uniref:HIT family protein n=1 Tax=Pelomonas sp. SE-A7 TaxID=3054953 RepID=UPI00259D200B|nr:HIT family protein [Pelomonas sp. SE-A7]MDM4766045.1 HIT family protein [Pelomonas sp. SE-A7]